MKKTLIALMALAGVAMADTVTLSSKLSYVNATDSSQNFSISAYDTFVNQTRENIDNYKINDTNYIDADRLNDVPASDGAITLNLGAMYGADQFASYTNGLVLNSISFIGRNDDNKTEDATLTLTVDGVDYVSNAASYSRTGSNHGSITFTFENGPTILTLGDISATFSKSFGSGVFKALNGAELTGANNNNASENWNVIAQVGFTAVAEAPETPVVPEPATATLSLLALCGLAARRRRK